MRECAARRSDHDTNYAELVSAHLRRPKQYPPDALSRGEQGKAAVSFSLDGDGRVTSARVVRGSGFASIDGDATAMVHRASPFPAPPSGRSVNFTLPVNYRLPPVGWRAAPGRPTRPRARQ